MTDLTTDQEMELSELLNAEIEVVECWHEWAKSRFIYWCQQCRKDGGDVEYHGVLSLIRHCKCGRKYQYSSTSSDCVKCGKMYFKNEANPNLFIPESFLTVFEAAEKLEGFKEKFYHTPSVTGGYRYGDVGIDIKLVASPHFPLEVLRWKNPEGLARVMKEKGGSDGCLCTYSL